MTTRRLAAILAADVVGFSKLIGEDEAGTLAALREIRKEIVNPVLAEHGGRVFKLMGDGMLAEFPSAVQALRAAIGIQERLRQRNAEAWSGQRIEVRIGVHQGDVVVEGSDLLGDGVNIAARLEGLAEPGGICISGRVHEDATGKIVLDAQDMGEQSLKNIARPVRAYRVSILERSRAVGIDEGRPALPLPDKPSLAVLPFQNMSGDPEQDYFADGMVEEIITALSRVRSFFVIARNSSFTYRGKAVDVKQVGRELGVRYVLEGSVRKTGNRVRITGQLIEAATNHHVWADRFEGTLEDIFDLQDRVTESIVGAIEPSLQHAEVERALRARPEDLTAYDLYLRALPHAYSVSVDGIKKALDLLNRALAEDSNFAQAHALAAWCYYWLRANGLSRQSDSDAIGLGHAERALALDPDDATVLRIVGACLAYLTREHDRALELTRRSIDLNPNSALGWALLGWVQLFARASPDQAMMSFEMATRLSPLDPMGWTFQAGIGNAHLAAGRNEQAVEWIERALRRNANAVGLLRGVAVALVRLNRLDQARDVAQKILAANPQFRVSEWRSQTPMRAAPETELFLSDLRLAGLPE
jgi:adenylate cyclase